MVSWVTCASGARPLITDEVSNCSRVHQWNGISERELHRIDTVKVLSKSAVGCGLSVR